MQNSDPNPGIIEEEKQIPSGSSNDIIEGDDSFDPFAPMGQPQLRRSIKKRRSTKKKEKSFFSKVKGFGKTVADSSLSGLKKVGDVTTSGIKKVGSATTDGLKTVGKGAASGFVAVSGQVTKGLQLAFGDDDDDEDGEQEK